MPVSALDVREPTQAPGWESLPADLQALFADVRLPATFMKRTDGTANFVVGPDLRVVVAHPLGRLVRFGSVVGTYGGDFCVNPANGEVVEVVGEYWRFVNSRLDLMTRTVDIALRFEQVFVTGNDEECWAAGEDLLDLLGQIDEPAADLENYWGIFATDAQAGNYSGNPNFSDFYE